jgi:hypothetical protein
MNKEDLLVCAQQCIKDKESCDASGCRFNINYEEEYNCTLISIYMNGMMSLRDIAKREGISFARVKQIQDKALIKIRKRLPQEQFYELLGS